MKDIEEKIEHALSYLGPDILEKVHPDVRRSLALQLELTYLNHEQYEYSDNLCIAEVGNAEQVELFKQSARRGCCGRHDEVFWHHSKDGTILGYLIGFNYGH
jgi:hypothetical protein